MRASAFLSAALLSAVPAFAQTCNRDNCARAVLGGVSSAQHVSDCTTNLVCTTTLTTVTTTSTSVSSPAVVTVSTTPAAGTVSTTSTISGSTITTTTSTTLGTATVTSTVTPSPVVVTTTAFTTFARRSVGLERRQGQACGANTVPAYAAACGAFSRYSSACANCAGVTASTSTVSTGTRTVTVTSTATTSTTTVTVVAGQSTTTVLTTLSASTTTLTVSASSATTTTTTTLSTSTTTTTSLQASATAPSCNNQGLQFAYYEDSQPAGFANDNNRFDPTVVKTRAPVFTGVTTSAGYINIGAPPAPAPVYGVSPANGTAPRQFSYIVNHRGYIFAQTTGTYTFSVSQVDDIVDTWINGVAYSGWNNFNAASRVFFQGNSNYQRSSQTFSFFLNAGTYTPLRVIFKQNGGDAAFAYSVVAPNGQEILGQSTAGNQGIVQFGCDVGNAAIYPPFGSET